MTKNNAWIGILYIIILVISQPLLAGQLEEGRKAYLSERYKKALKILTPLAEEGNAKAQEMVAIMYDLGQGVEKQPEFAMSWYEKSALQGNVTLQHDLGIRYFKGDRVAQSYEQAARWWKMAAEAGVAESQYNLGLMLAKGMGVEKDEVQAVRYYELAAAQNHVNAQYSLGIAYAFGQGVAVDYEKALAFFDIAARNGVPQAQYNLAVLHENGRGTDVDHDQARYWYEKAAANGIEQAKRKVAAPKEVPVEKEESALTQLGFNKAQTTETPAQLPAEDTTEPEDSNDLIKQLNSQLLQERQRAATLSSEITESKLEIEQLKKAALEEENANAALSEQIASANQLLEESQRQVSTLKARLNEQQSTEQALLLQVESASLEKARAESNIETSQAELAELRKEIENLIADADRKSSTEQQTLQELQLNYDAAISAQQRLEQDLANVRADLSETRELLTASEKVAQSLNKLSQLDEQSESINNETAQKNQALSEQFEASREQVSALKKQLAMRQQQEEELRITLDSIKLEKEQIDVALTASRSEAASLTRELDELKRNRANNDLAQSTQKALTEELEQIANEKSALENQLADKAITILAIQDLLGTRGSRDQDLTSLVASTIEENQVVSEELSIAQQEINTLKTQLTQLSASIGDSESLAKKQLKLEQDIASAEREKSQLEFQLQTALNQIVRMEESAATASDSGSNLEEKLAVANNELSAAQQTILDLKAQIDARGAALPILGAQPTVKITRYTSFAGKSDWGRNTELFTEIHEENWIKDQEPDYYFLQLITLPNKKFVDKFFELYPLLDAEKALYVSRKGDKRLYNVIYGVYEDMNSALRGIEGLPEGIRKKEPLVRNYSNIQRYLASSN